MPAQPEADPTDRPSAPRGDGRRTADREPDLIPFDEPVDEARPSALPTVAGAAAEAPPGGATIVLEPTDAPTPSTGTLRYARRSIPVRHSCATDVYLDLDEPRAVRAAAGPDVRTGCAGVASALRLGPGATGGAVTLTATSWAAG